MLHSLNLFISSILNVSANRYIFALIGGLLLATTLPFIGFSIYIWIALIPLILLVKSSNKISSVIIEAFVFLFIYNLISFAWLLGLHPLTWHGFSINESILITSLAWLIPSLFHSLIAMIFVVILRLFYQFRTDHRSNELRNLDLAILAFVWVVLEHKVLIYLGVFSVPINFLVYSQYSNQILIQISNLIGAIGLEYFIVIVNLWISNFLNVQRSNYNLGQQMRRTNSELNINQPYFGVQQTNEEVKIGIILFICLLVILFYGLININISKHYYQKNQRKMKSFAVIQADYSASSSRGSNASPQTLLALQYELSSKLTSPVDLLLWTEGAVPLVDKSIVQEELHSLSQFTKVFAYGTYTENSKGQFYNSIEIRDFVRNRILTYHKQNLVPFGEYTPFYSFFPAPLQKIASSSVGEGFSASTNKQKLLKSSVGNFTGALCFELLFPELVRSEVLKGANAIINLNDLSWFRSNSFTRDWVKKQFLAVAVFRAVENKRDLILAGNSGYSAIINSYGQIEDITGANRIAILQGNFMPIKEISLFSLYGW